MKNLKRKNKRKQFLTYILIESLCVLLHEFRLICVIIEEGFTNDQNDSEIEQPKRLTFELNARFI